MSHNWQPHPTVTGDPGWRCTRCMEPLRGGVGHWLTPCPADAALTNILKRGTFTTMTLEQRLRAVARQVAASQRLAGFETTEEDVLAILRKEQL